MRNYLSIAAEVTEALRQGRPVVALESTVIAHGMPYPRNLDEARALETVVRDNGATPATIAVLDGRIRVGLADADLERLAAGGQRIAKLSRRDLPVVLGRGGDGATTVAATMIVARLAGIAVFATGGIGGVHRGAELTFDVSADLDELARTSVCVVSAGAKSILDLPKTLEVLETRGVPVLGFGTGTFPAFYVRDSGLPVSHRCDDVDEVARIMLAKWRLGMDGGVLVANPIPHADALDAATAEAAIVQALADATASAIAGPALTPFLLGRLEAITGGCCLEANVALIRNNAVVAAGIAAAYGAHQRAQSPARRPSLPGRTFR
jgi:pseudouridine-5'-phosphate glycosidase